MAKKLTYKKAGVDIAEGQRFVERIIPFVQSTKRKGVVGKIGGFGGFFNPPSHYRRPLLVSSTDGVGTKLKLAVLLDKHDTVGIDLVAMSVNDVVTTGAEPLFFLDYISTGKIDRKKLVDVVRGIARGCRTAGCALIGGETAEMPDIYKKSDYDLAGFCLGVVEKEKVIDGSSVKAGDAIIGLASSGLHSNGFSLVRKLFSRKELKAKWGRELLKPTKIYVKPILALAKGCRLKAVAHITGGGFYDNIPRSLPKGLTACIKKNSWPVPSVFKEIQQRAGLNAREMFRTFNMGIGMVLVIGKKDANGIKNKLTGLKAKSFIIGEVGKGRMGVEIK